MINKQENGEKIAKAILVSLLVDFVQFYNIGKSMNESQVVSTVELMLEDYSVLKPDDFVLFFSKAKKGHYGKVYDRIDGAVIFEWLEQFMHERDTEIEAIRRNESKRLDKSIIDDKQAVPMPDYVRETIKSIGKKEIKQSKPMSQTESQKEIQSWINDFRDLWIAQGEKPGIKTVEIDGKNLDQTDYLEYRISKI